MSRFTQRGATGPLAFAQTSTDANLASLVGSRFETEGGREFVLVQNAGTALASGKLVQSPATIANHLGMVCSTQVIGDTTITVTLGATLVTANQYQGGFLTLTEGTGAGQTLKIAGHPAAAQSTTCVLTLEDPIQVATATASTKGSISLNSYGSANGTDVSTNGVIITPTTLTGRIVGVSTSPIPASTATVPSYGFIQTKGIVSLLNQGGTTIGLNLGNSASVAGAATTYAAASTTLVGSAVVAGTDTKYALASINIG